MVLTEIRVTRVDGEPIEEGEVQALMNEFKSLFPAEVYRLLHQTKPNEDNEVLHVYINLEAREGIRRCGTLGKYTYIVPAKEAEERLTNW